ncbi:MAG TPA: uracil-DNA glycosylase family protein [Sphingomonas sp.]|nr:uracil-DNA glycosylase family protein [Sphingomonas sp.]
MGADQHIDWKHAAASALDWWHDAGVDTLVDETPRRWLEAAPQSRPAQAVPTESAPALPTTLADFEAWRVSAAAPDAGWGAPIGPQGSAESRLMILLDMPERGDAASGQLLSGEAGRLFDNMLAAIGRDRQSIYLASLAVARPASGRIAAERIGSLADVARHHIALAQPKRLLLLGDAANRALLGVSAAATRPILHVLNHGAGQTEAVASFHPRFLLDNPAQKARAWRDLQVLIGGIDA